MEKAKAFLADVTAGGLEPLLDVVMDEGVLRDIPLLSSAIGIARASKSVRDALFLKKTQSLLESFEGVSKEERRKMSERLAQDSESERIGEKLIFSLERADEVAKAKLIAECFIAYLREWITRDELYKFWHGIDRCFLDELKCLTGYSAERYCTTVGDLSLVYAGFVVNEGALGGTMYKLTPMGRRFKQTILHVFSLNTSL